MVNLENLMRPVLGGFILALATSCNLIVKGRISGFSGIYFGLITFNEFISKLSFVSGVFWICNLFYVLSSEKSYYDSHYNYLGDLSILGFSISGLLVGFGTKLANGCTSGHGLYELAILSPRSIVSVLIFLMFAIITCTLRSNYHFLDSAELIELSKQTDIAYIHYIYAAIFTIVLLILLYKNYAKKDFIVLFDVLISFVIGALMGLGLKISGMNKRTKVRDFLNLNLDTWDPTLMILLGVSVSLNLIIYFLVIKKREKPIYAERIGIPTNNKIDYQLMVGSAIFGIGWGISGICPGPALVDLFIYVPHVFLLLFCMAICQIIAYSLTK